MSYYIKKNSLIELLHSLAHFEIDSINTEVDRLQLKIIIIITLSNVFQHNPT